MIVFYFVAIPIYNGLLMLGYATIYTSLPVFMLVFDEDTERQHVLEFPPLYKTLQKGRALSFKTFCIWVWKSIYQGSVILITSVIFFNDSFANIVTITFSALICIELLNVFSEINKINYKMIFVLIAAAIVYFLSIVLFKNYFDISYISPAFGIKIIMIVAIAWLPIFLVERIIDKCDPSEHKKIHD
jgi:phospholipid-translocating ATPase